MPQELMQHETRQEYIFHDQHQRPWRAIVDTRTKPHLAPCTPLEPAGWVAPIMPPGDLVRAHPTVLGTLVILYSQWQERADSAEATYLQVLGQVADKMFGDQAPRAMAERDARLVAEVGPPPEAAVFVQAAEAGNPWVLGLDPADQVPSWAKPHLLTLPQYRREQRAAQTTRTAFPSLAEEQAAEQGASGDAVAVLDGTEDPSALFADPTPAKKAGAKR